MTKPEAIAEARKRLAETGITQIVSYRGDNFEVTSSHAVLPRGMRPAEFISQEETAYTMISALSLG